MLWQRVFYRGFSTARMRPSDSRPIGTFTQNTQCRNNVVVSPPISSQETLAKAMATVKKA